MSPHSPSDVEGGLFELPVGSAVGCHVGSSVSVEPMVGGADWPQEVGSSVGTGVNSTEGVGVGTAGTLLGAGVIISSDGDAVGCAVGAAVGCLADGDKVGSGVGSVTGSSGADVGRGQL